jgi:hypothetical protein
VLKLQHGQIQGRLPGHLSSGAFDEMYVERSISVGLVNSARILPVKGISHFRGQLTAPRETGEREIFRSALDMLSQGAKSKMASSGLSQLWVSVQVVQLWHVISGQSHQP